MTNNLINSIIEWDLNKIKENINLNNINYIDNIWTCLHYGVATWNVEIVKLLINNTNININFINSFGFSVLNTAISNNDLEIVKLLLETDNIDVNEYDSKISPLNQAINYYLSWLQWLDIIRLLLKRSDLNINQILEKWLEPIKVAIINQNLPLIKILLERSDLDLSLKDILFWDDLLVYWQWQWLSMEIVNLINKKRINNELMNNINLTFFDTETTWLNIENDVVIQIAYINEIDWKEVDKSVSYYSNWDRKISLWSKVAHWIIEEQLIWFEEFSEDSKEFEFIKNNLDKTIFIAHNAKYDVNILKKYWLYIDNYIDTLRVAKYLMQDYEEDFEYSYKEQNLKYYLMEKWIIFPDKAKAHDAMWDIEVLRVIFYYLFTKIKELFNLDDYEIISKMSEITFNPFLLKRINFWKYKWLDFKEIAIKDPDYLDWLYREEIKKIDKWEENIDLIYTCKTLLYWD